VDSEPDRPSRAIIYEPQYTAELERIEPDFFRADECLSGLLWVLIRDPTLGYQSTDDPNVWFYPLHRDDFPGVVVYYTFDDTKLCFLSIRRIDELNGHHEV
jgi:hypothetical protein